MFLLWLLLASSCLSVNYLTNVTFPVLNSDFDLEVDCVLTTTVYFTSTPMIPTTLTTEMTSTSTMTSTLLITESSSTATISSSTSTMTTAPTSTSLSTSTTSSSTSTTSSSSSSTATSSIPSSFTTSATVTSPTSRSSSLSFSSPSSSFSTGSPSSSSFSTSSSSSTSTTLIPTSSSSSTTTSVPTSTTSSSSTTTTSTSPSPSSFPTTESETPLIGIASTMDIVLETVPETAGWTTSTTMPPPTRRLPHIQLTTFLSTGIYVSTVPRNYDINAETTPSDSTSGVPVDNEDDSDESFGTSESTASVPTVAPIVTLWDRSTVFSSSSPTTPIIGKEILSTGKVPEETAVQTSMAPTSSTGKATTPAPASVSTTLSPTPSSPILDSSNKTTSSTATAEVKPTPSFPTLQPSSPVFVLSNKTTSSTDIPEVNKTTSMFTTLSDLLTSKPAWTKIPEPTSTAGLPGSTFVKPVGTQRVVDFSSPPTASSPATTGKEERTGSPFSSGTSTGTSSSSSDVSESSPTSFSTEPASTTSPYITFSSTDPYIQGCSERCPEGALPGGKNCYSLVEGHHNEKYSTATSACAKSKTGHLITRRELLHDQEILRDWLENWNVSSKAIYVGQRPYHLVDGKAMGIWTTMSNISYEKMVTEIFPAQQEMENVQGICSLPAYCGNFDCDFVDIYARLKGLLVLPMPSPIKVNQWFTIQCASPSYTEFRVKCSVSGQLSPTSALKTCELPRTFSREVSTPGNKPLRTSCQDCFVDGTGSCTEVGNDFECNCLQGWSKNTCWKSPASCYARKGTSPVCLNSGECIPVADLHECRCHPSYGWEDCSLHKDAVSWFGTNTTAGFVTPAKVSNILTTVSPFVVVLFKVASKFAPFLWRPEDSDVHTNVVLTRQVLLSFSGNYAVFYSAPGFMDLNPMGCRVTYFLVHWLFSWAMWEFLLESLNIFMVFTGRWRNRYEFPVEKRKNVFRYKQPHRSLLLNRIVLQVLVPGLLMGFYYAATFSGWDSVISSFSCLGPLAKYNPLVQAGLHLNIMMALLRPEKFAENVSYHECHVGPIRMDRVNKLKRVVLPQMIQAPVRMACFLLQILAQDSVGYSRDQSHLDLYIYAFTALDVLLGAYSAVVLKIEWFERLMQTMLPRVPAFMRRLFPTFSPVRYLSHEEILAAVSKVPMEENNGFPSTPADEFYVSLERRHQFDRFLTKSYLGMRLRAYKQAYCVEQAELAVANKFAQWMPLEEDHQWEAQLAKWQREILEADQYLMRIPRTRPEDRTVYLDRLRGAWVFSASHIGEENSNWLRMRLLFELLGNVPLEPRHSSWTQDHCGVIRKQRVRQPQIRHHSQVKGVEDRIEKLLEASRELGEREGAVWTALAPELYPENEEDKLKLAKLPGVERYLKVFLMDSLCYQAEKIRLIKEEDALMERMKEERPHWMVRFMSALVNWKFMKPISLKKQPLPTEEHLEKLVKDQKSRIFLIHGFDEQEWEGSILLEEHELGRNQLVKKNKEPKKKRKRIPPLCVHEPVDPQFSLWMDPLQEME